MWQAGRLPVETLLTSISPMSEINQLLDGLADGRAIRQVMVPIRRDPRYSLRSERRLGVEAVDPRLKPGEERGANRFARDELARYCS